MTNTQQTIFHDATSDFTLTYVEWAASENEALQAELDAEDAWFEEVRRTEQERAEAHQWDLENERSLWFDLHY